MEIKITDIDKFIINEFISKFGNYESYEVDVINLCLGDDWINDAKIILDDEDISDYLIVDRFVEVCEKAYQEFEENRKLERFGI